LAYTTPDLAAPETIPTMEGLYPQAHGATDADCANGAIQDIEFVTSRIADLTMGFHGIYNRYGGTFPSPPPLLTSFPSNMSRNIVLALTRVQHTLLAFLPLPAHLGTLP